MITTGGGCTTEVVVRAVSIGRTGEAKSEGNGVGEEDSATIAVMTGAAVVVEVSS